MKRGILCLVALLAPTVVAAQEADVAAVDATAEAPTDAAALIADASAAAPASISDGATVMDWEGNTLREGSNGWTCMPTPPGLPGKAPMCLDGQWTKWAHAWMNRTQPEITAVGVGYMLAGDTGASNSDPFATGPEAVDDWVDAGPHIMIVVPDGADLEAVPTDPAAGTWVMWKGTPYAHIMVATEGLEMAE